MKPCQHGCCLAGTAGQADCFTSLMPLSCALAALKCTLTLQSCLPLTEEMEPKFVTHQIYTNLFYLPVSDHYPFWTCQTETSFQIKLELLEIGKQLLNKLCMGISFPPGSPTTGRSVIFLGDNWSLRKVQLPDGSVWCLGPKR